MQKKMTAQRLYNIALHYLSKYDAGSEKIRRMLMRRLENDAYKNKTTLPDETHEWIEEVVQKLIRLGYINDTNYIHNRIRILSESGKSLYFIRQKLKQEGFSFDFIDEITSTCTQTDLERAIRFVQRKKMGYLRPVDKQALYLKKDLATLVRAGFSYPIARNALTNNDSIDTDDIPTDIEENLF